MADVATPPLRVVVMGVSGCGKSTIGQALAAALGLSYLEGDALHPAENVARMAAGIALTDADRQGWLQAIAHELNRATGGLVVSCSALKRSYRDLLRSAAPGLQLVHLHGDAALLAARMQERRGHYMPPSLLQSQLDTLEVPGDDEGAITIDFAEPAPSIIDALLSRLKPFTAPSLTPSAKAAL